MKYLFSIEGAKELNFSLKKTTSFYWLILSFGVLFFSINAFAVKWKIWGQSPPKMKPVPFAPTIIPARMTLLSCLTLSLDERTFLWAVSRNPASGAIVFSNFDGETLSKPEFLSGLNRYNYGSPFYSYDGKKIYFSSSQPFPGEQKAPFKRVWVVEADGSNWNSPKPLGGEINSVDVGSQISISRCGNIYFAASRLDKLAEDIYVSRLINDVYTKPIPLKGKINSEFIETDPFIDPEERYLIFSSARKENCGAFDLYISYNQLDNEWSDAIHLEEPINSKYFDRFPSITRDGKYLFFVRNDNPLQFPGGKTQFFWVNLDLIKNKCGQEVKIPRK